jgi:hypothetical protein
VLFLRRFVEFLKQRAQTNAVVSQSCVSFLADIAAGVNVDAKTLRFCYDRLSSLMKTLEIHNTDDYWPIQARSSLHVPYCRYRSHCSLLLIGRSLNSCIEVTATRLTSACTIDAQPYAPCSAPVGCLCTHLCVLKPATDEPIPEEDRSAIERRCAQGPKLTAKVCAIASAISRNTAL